MIFDTEVDEKKIHELNCAVCGVRIKAFMIPIPNGEVSYGFYNATFKGKSYPLCKEHYDAWNVIIERQLKKFLKKDINAVFV